MPPLVALRSASASRTLPVALPVRNEAAWYASPLFARADSGIASIRDLVQARVAWVDPQSTAGYLVVRAWMQSHHLNFGQAFADEVFLGLHEAVVDAVLAGQADVGAAYAHLAHDQRTVRSAAWGSAPVNVVALSSPIPNDVLSASIRLPVATIRKVRDSLIHPSDALRVASTQLFNAQGFIAAEAEHITPLMNVLKHLDDTGRRAPSTILAQQNARQQSLVLSAPPREPLPKAQGL